MIKQDTIVATRWLSTLEDFSDETALLNLSVSHDGIHVGVVKDILNEEQMLEIAQACESKGGKVLYRTTADGGREPYEFNITYPSAVGRVDAFLACQAIQLALRGVPFIYFNNFIGAENWTEGVEQLGYSRAINRQKFDYRELIKELRDPHSQKHQTYTGYVKLIKARINEPLFSPVVRQDILSLDPKLMVIKRYHNKESLLAITNVSESALSLGTAELKDQLGKDEVTDILSGDKVDLDDELQIGAYQSIWLK
jgi:sucrose phosphorylase